MKVLSVYFSSTKPNNYNLFNFTVPPLFVIELLHRAVDIFEEYFSECNESSLKEEFCDCL